MMVTMITIIMKGMTSRMCMALAVKLSALKRRYSKRTIRSLCKIEDGLRGEESWRSIL